MNRKMIFQQFKDIASDNWKLIDFVALKSKIGDLFFDTYYLEGHAMYEHSLTNTDMKFIDFTREIGVYGISEKMDSSNKDIDKFYIRTNISNEKQELSLINYLVKNKLLSNNQKDIINYLRNMDIGINDNDYRALYFCGFSKNVASKEFDSIRFYFKCFGVNEMIDNSLDYLKYCEQDPMIRKDITFQIIKQMIIEEQVKLRFIGIEISNTNELKIKYYISQSKETVDLSDLLLYLKNYKQYEINAENLIKSLPDISIYKCSLIQLSSGYTNEGECINMYFEKNQNNKKIFYSIKEGIVLRDVGGVVFLIDIHEKYYYDYKNMFSVNDIGKVIIKFALNNKVFTIEAVVSYLKSIIKDYHPEMYSLIYSDCQKFINELLDLGYVEEIK